MLPSPFVGFVHMTMFLVGKQAESRWCAGGGGGSGAAFDTVPQEASKPANKKNKQARYASGRKGPAWMAVLVVLLVEPDL